MVDSTGYLLQVCKYIHLNPVKANVISGINFEWSSYTNYINSNDDQKNWLYKNEIIGFFDKINFNEKFIEYHQQDSAKELINFYDNITLEHSVLGSEDFKIKIQKETLMDYSAHNISLDELKQSVMRYFKITEEEFATTPGSSHLARIIFYYVAYKICKYKLVDVAKYSSHDASIIYSALYRQKSVLARYNITEGLSKNNINIVIAELEKLF